MPEQLRITWAGGAAFLDALDRQGPGRYRVAMPGARAVLRAPAVGRQLAVELEFVDSSRTFRHVARVVDHDVGPPEIVTFEFRPEDGAIRELIVCHAEGKSIPYLNRRAERRPVWLPVEVKLGETWRHGIAIELSELGTFVAIKDPPAPGQRVAVRIPTEAGSRLEVETRVVYTRSGNASGFAGEFAYKHRTAEVRIRAALRAALQATKR